MRSVKKKMKAVFERQREAVRKMMNDRDLAEQAEASNKTKKAPVAKPLWAMTEKEKEDFEEEEGDDLINFAENLDYEKFLGDLEFRQGMAALRDRTGKLKKEQDAFKDALVQDFNAIAEADEDKSTSAGSPRSTKLEDGIDGQSLLGDLRSEYSVGSGKRSMGEGRYAQGKPDWDTSTNAGDDRPPVDREVKNAAEMVLESAPQIRAIHSKESVQRIIEKTREKQGNQQGPVDLAEHMHADRVPIPVIVASADTQTRLHKPPEPSLLPYLYRSPAI